MDMILGSAIGSPLNKLALMGRQPRGRKPDRSRPGGAVEMATVVTLMVLVRRTVQGVRSAAGPGLWLARGLGGMVGRGLLGGKLRGQLPVFRLEFGKRRLISRKLLRKLRVLILRLRQVGRLLLIVKEESRRKR